MAVLGQKGDHVTLAVSELESLSDVKKEGQTDMKTRVTQLMNTLKRLKAEKQQLATTIDEQKKTLEDNAEGLKQIIDETI